MTGKGSTGTLVIVSNMYPSNEHPAYGVFVKRFVEQMSPHFRVVPLVMQKTDNPLTRAFRYAKTNARLSYSLITNRQAIHYIHFPLYFAPALLISPLVSTQVVLNFHGTDNVIDRPFKRLLCWMLRHSIASMQIVAPSAALLSQVAQRYNLCPDRLHVSASAGVHSHCFHPIEKTNPAGNSSAHRIGFVGNLLSNKGWDVFLDTAIALDQRQQCGPMQFIIAGSGHGESELLERLKCSTLDIQRLETLEQAELAELFSSLDVLVFPSYRESLGLVALECLACGTPVVAHDISGPREYIVAGVNGNLCPVGNINSLATAVEHILNLDASARQRMKFACVESAHTYDANAIAEQMHTFLQSLFARNSDVQDTRSNGSAAP